MLEDEPTHMSGSDEAAGPGALVQPSCNLILHSLVSFGLFTW